MDAGLTARLICIPVLVHLLAPTRGDGKETIGGTTTAMGHSCNPATVTLESAHAIDRVDSLLPFSDDEAHPLAITLRIRDTAPVPNDVLVEAKQDVTRIYREAGVETAWPTPESLSAESNAVRKAVLTVAILSLDQAQRIAPAATDDRIGFTLRSPDGGGQVAYVVYDRVERLTGGNGLRRARMLAIAMAHEIGHLLLPCHAHSRTGLMRAKWTHGDLQIAQRGLIFFTAAHARLLRSRIVALRGALASDDRVQLNLPAVVDPLPDGLTHRISRD